MTLEDAIAFNDRLAARLTPAPLFVLCVLYERMGRTQSHAALADAVFDLSAQRPSYDAIRTAVALVRRSGVVVETVHSLGYRLDAPPPMRV